MDIKTLSQIKSNFVAREVGNELIIVPLTGNVAQMNELFTLNETAKFLWENIQEQTTLEELESLLTNEFDVSPEIAQRDIDVFLTNMNVLIKK